MSTLNVFLSYSVKLLCSIQTESNVKVCFTDRVFSKLLTFCLWGFMRGSNCNLTHDSPHNNHSQYGATVSGMGCL